MNIGVGIVLITVRFLYLFDQLASKKISQKLVLSAVVFAALLSIGFYINSVSKLNLSAISDGFINDLSYVSEDPSVFKVLGGQDIRRVEPSLVREYLSPHITARSALAIDVKTGKTLYSINPEFEAAPASTSKLMTALVALDLYELDHTFKVPLICTTVDSSKAWLPADHEFSVEVLVNTLLISSAGDSACVLASGVGFEKFVELMNEKAQSFGMDHTFFTNPIGLDGIDDAHKSTSSDLYKLSLRSMRNPILRDAVSKTDYYFSSKNGEYISHIVNTNQLLWDIPGSVGIKTGTTVSAGQVLIYEYKQDEKDIVIIIMGSVDRFEDTKKILSWILNSYSWQ